MLNWMKAFRRKSGRTEQERLEVRLIRAMAGQISIPQKAGPVLEAVDAFEHLDEAAMRSELPRIYLLLEQYLCDVDPVRRLSRSHLREVACTDYPTLVREMPFSIVFDPADRQEVILCRTFMLDVLNRAIHVLGEGAALSKTREWIACAPAVPDRDAPLELECHPPDTDAAWIEALIDLAGLLYEQLRVGLGEATAGIYDAAYAAMAHRYAGLETFPVIVRLLPDGLLDEQRIQSLARHATMARVQGELSEAQRSALDSAKQLQAVLSTVGEGIITVDAEGRMVLVNREVERTFGYQADDLIGGPLGRLLELPFPFGSRLGKPVNADGRRRDGSTFPVEVTFTETQISADLYYTAAVRDVTLQRKYERDLLEAKEHAEEMTRLKTAFLANMSHEIRTPISGILGAVQVLEEEIPQSHVEFTRMVDSSARRLLTTLDSVLEFARLEAASHEAVPRPVDLADALKAACNRHVVRARDKGLTIQVEPSSATAYADRDGLERILDVLIDNAVRFTHGGGVYLTAYLEEGEVVVEVRDDGIGISPDFLPHVFDEFRQESTGHARSHEGTGLGLAIARRHAEAMGGRMRVESEQGRGSTFRLYLPPHRERPDEAGSHRAVNKTHPA